MIAFDAKLRAEMSYFFLSFFSQGAQLKKKKTLPLDQIFRAATFFCFFPEREGNIKRTDVQTHVAPHHAAVQTAACEKRCRFCWRLIAAADLIEFHSNIEKDNSA